MTERKSYKMNVGDFVMFRKRGSQWTSPSPYHYGMITKVDEPYERHFSRKNKYTILCSSGELIYQVKEREVIILTPINSIKEKA